MKTGEKSEMKNLSNNASSALAPLNTVLSKREAIVWCCAFTVSSAIIITGNLLTIALFTINKRLQKKHFVLLINMASADLMLGAVSLPVFIYSVVWKTYEQRLERMTSTFTIFRGVSTIFYSQASIIFAAFISGERVFATYWPLRHRVVSLKSYRSVCYSAWALVLLSTAILSLLRILVSREAYSWLWVQFTASLIAIICGCNIGVWRKFQKRRFTQNARSSQKRQLTKTLLLISLLALLSWLPIIILNIFQTVNYSVNKNIYFTAVFLNISSCFVNPVTYFVRIHEFRQALIANFYKRKTMRGDTYVSVGRDRAFSIFSVLSNDFVDVLDTKL